MPTIRNAAGVLKDVSESWATDWQGPSGKKISKKRFHYLFAIFSKTEFSKPAQDYAYAQDIYLLPLGRSDFIKSIINKIERISAKNIPNKPPLKSIRQYVRGRLNNDFGRENVESIPNDLLGPLEELINECNSPIFGFITMFGGQFPVFLIANPEFNPSDIRGITFVRIRRRNGVWFITDREERSLFSFDLPEEIFEQYWSARGRRAMVAKIKGDLMHEFFAFGYFHGEFQLLHFQLDMNWFTSIRKNLEIID